MVSVVHLDLLDLVENLVHQEVEACPVMMDLLDQKVKVETVECLDL